MMFLDDFISLRCIEGGGGGWGLSERSIFAPVVLAVRVDSGAGARAAG